MVPLVCPPPPPPTRVRSHRPPLPPPPPPLPLATTINFHVASPAVRISSDFSQTHRGTSWNKRQTRTNTYIYSRNPRRTFAHALTGSPRKTFPRFAGGTFTYFTRGTSGNKRRLLYGCDFCLKLAKLFANCRCARWRTAKLEGRSTSELRDLTNRHIFTE